MLCGGAGNDIIVYHENDFVDGGLGIDVLLLPEDGVTTMDTLLDHAKDIHYIDAIVTKGGDKIHSMNDLADKGVTVDDAANKVEFSTDWTQVATQTINGKEYIEMDSVSNEMTILVQQTLLTNG